jgi:hypothetical protein
MAFNSAEFAWKDLSVTAMGRTFERIMEVEYDVEVDLKYIYGRGAKVKGIQDGREKPQGSLTLGQSEVEAMIRTAQTTNKNAKLTDIVFDIQIHYFNGVELVKDKVVQARFTKQPKSFKEGDSDMQVKLPFMMKDVLYNVA